MKVKYHGASNLLHFEDHTKEPCSFLVNDTTLPSENPLQFRRTCYKNDF